MSNFSDDKNETPLVNSPIADYRVGYRCPPLNTRFKPGQIANPRGRPRKKQAALKDILLAPTPVTVGKHDEMMPLIDTLLIRAKSRALIGDPRALHYLIELTGSSVLAKKIIRALE
jgi:hypothetical protein